MSEKTTRGHNNNNNNNNNARTYVYLGIYSCTVMWSSVVGNAPWQNTAAVQILLSPRRPSVRPHTHIYICVYNRYTERFT